MYFTQMQTLATDTSTRCHRLHWQTQMLNMNVALEMVQNHSQPLAVAVSVIWQARWRSNITLRVNKVLMHWDDCGIKVNRYNLHSRDTKSEFAFLSLSLTHIMISQWLIDYQVFAQTTRWHHSSRMRTVSNVAHFVVVVVDVSRELDSATGASVPVD